MARPWRRTHLGTEADRATFRTLHRASLASPALREGLTEESAQRSVKHLRVLLGTPAMALTDTAGPLAWDGQGEHHAEQLPNLVAGTIDRGHTRSFDRGDLQCGEPGCPIRTAVVSPLAQELAVLVRQLTGHMDTDVNRPVVRILRALGHGRKVQT
jgi:two-component system, LytTR family, sensor kinase